MPLVYISPSTQQFNSYLTSGTEEQYMNLVADALEPYLVANGIDFARNNPSLTAGDAVNESNALNADLHVAIHSNASPPGLEGILTGSDVYYNPGNPDSIRFAQLMRNALRQVYYEPENVEILPADNLGEVLRTAAPSVLIETAYHDNARDEQWIKDNLDGIARAIAMAVTDYFGYPFIDPYLLPLQR